MKFQRLFKEQTSYKLNDKGKKLVEDFQRLVKTLEDELCIFDDYLHSPEKSRQELAIKVISEINSQKLGNELFDMMSRLYVMTNGGKANVSDSYTFNENDSLLNYLEKIE